ncbi:MAG TPA: DUF1493 family protein [Flavobacterium sp.]|nr:DUF1493 family protein [Flavobacterium sp.]
MSNKKDLKNDVIFFIKNIDENTNIASPQYKIFDIDAEYVMEYFFKEFKIEFSNFKIENYFLYPDYSWKSILFIRLFFKQKKPAKLSLTINHLIKVAEKGEWFDPIG